MIHSIGNNLKHSAYMGEGEVIVGWNWCHHVVVIRKNELDI